MHMLSFAQYPTQMLYMFSGFFVEMYCSKRERSIKSASTGATAAVAASTPLSPKDTPRSPKVTAAKSSKQE
jgi:hypothetical protein